MLEDGKKNGRVGLTMILFNPSCSVAAHTSQEIIFLENRAITDILASDLGQQMLLIFLLPCRI